MEYCTRCGAYIGKYEGESKHNCGVIDDRYCGSCGICKVRTVMRMTPTIVEGKTVFMPVETDLVISHNCGGS